MIIFEGKEIVIHYHQGSTDYILISFMFRDVAYNPLTDYFARVAIEKANITCIALTTKTSCWYISDEMETVLEICNALSRRYNKIVTFGTSMGGYGALKYARRLRATAVLALAPQYSIDPQECAHVTDEHRMVFLERGIMKSMGIRGHDVSGRAYLVYDPQHEYDAGNAQDIKREASQVVLIPSFYTNHFVPEHIKGTSQLTSIMDAINSGTDQDIISCITYIRRHHAVNLFCRLYAAMHKHPKLVFETLFCKDIKKLYYAPFLYEKKDLMNPLTSCLLYRGYQEEAVYLQSAYLNFIKTIDCVLPPQEGVEDFLLLCFHGLFLCYKPSENNFCVLYEINNTTCPPVYARRQGNDTKLVVQLNGTCHWIDIEEGRLKLCQSPETLQNPLIIKYSQKNCTISLKSPSGYLYVLPDYSIGLKSPQAQAWESFGLLPTSALDREINFYTG